jgi:hypothetical protein
MKEPVPPQSNFERLRTRLKKDGFAARLVNAQIDAGAAGEQAALEKVIADRMGELRQEYGGTENQKD